MKLEELAIVLTKAYRGFPNLVITREVVEAWHELFQSVDIRIFSAAMRDALLEPDRKFFPNFGEVNGYVKKLTATPEDLETPEIAFHRAYNSTGGVSKLGQQAWWILQDAGSSFYWKDKDLHWKQKEYIKIYNDLKARPQLQQTQQQIGTSREDAKRILGNVEIKTIN